MTLPGGPADKIGNRYERLWTTNQLLRLLDGQCQSIRLEEPGIDKAEFVVRLKDRREFHQTKHTHSQPSWTLASLDAEGVLHSIRELLRDSKSSFVFVSNCAANELADLCESAKSSASDNEFISTFLDASTRRTSFERLCRKWHCDSDTAIDFLRRIDVRTIGERELQEQVLLFARTLFLADEQSVLNELRHVIDESVHQTITRDGLDQHMQGRGHVLRTVTGRQQAVRVVRQVTDSFLNAARRRLILQELVHREATESIKKGIVESTTVLIGRAGAGKTTCTVELIESLLARGCQVFAFRLDRHVTAHNTKNLGQQLGLEESPVLLLSAAAETSGSKGVLVVDQLDAVSTMSGRSSEALDLVSRLLGEAAAVRNRIDLHVLVVCRSFDWNNDHRLRQLISSDSPCVSVDEFTEEETKTLLQKGGFEPTLFRKRQLQLLRSPQNLSLFMDGEFSTCNEPRFDTVKELFDRFWDVKRGHVAQRADPSNDCWVTVLNLMCTEMNTTQELSVRREVLDRVPPDYLKQMASEGVLVRDDKRYSFGHESFFDYSFARLTYLQGSDSLASMLKASEQHLFRRSQVRQVLTYVRDANFVRYLEEVRGLLRDDSVRAHIKVLVFALLADVSDPNEKEWQIWLEWTRTEFDRLKRGLPNCNKLSSAAWRYLFKSKPWFKFLDSNGVIQRLLASGNDNLMNVATNYLGVHQEHYPDAVAQLLVPYQNGNGDWPDRLKSFVEWADLGGSRQLFDFFLRLIDNGTLDSARGPVAVNSTFWDLVRPIQEKQAAWVGEVIAHWIKRRASILQSERSGMQGATLLGHDMGASEIFSQAARSAPLKFVEHVLPVVLDVSDATIEGDSPPYRDAFWTYRIKTAHPDADEACLNALELAAGKVAETESAECCEEIEAYLEERESHLANHLLLALYRGNARHLAGKMVSTLCQQPWRFECGYMDNPRWYAVKTISKLVPHCTCEQRDKLEQVILNYIPEFEREAERRAGRGLSQFALLAAIPKVFRSRKAEQRFLELERKFGRPPSEPEPLEAHRVESPISSAESKKMTDEQWLKAVVRYSGDEWRDVPGGITGGVHELSQVLKGCVEEEPERFARLVLRFDADTSPQYMQNVLLGISQVELESRLKMDVCLKAFDESREACGAEIADVIGSMSGPLSDEALKMITWLATEHPDPAREMWEQDVPGGGKYYGGEILTYGINTVRGRAAIAIAKLVRSDPSVLSSFRCVLDRMLCDQSPAVLSCVADILAAIAVEDPLEAASLFSKMNVPTDRLLATPCVARLMNQLLTENFHVVEPYIESMICSNENEVCEQGAVLAGLAALRGHDAERLVDLCKGSCAPQRMGIARVASANISSSNYREWCEEQLLVLFDDEESNVRRKTASCFLQLQGEPLELYERLIGKFMDSKAFDDDSGSIFYALESSRLRLPGMTCLLCERFLDRFSDEARDFSNSRAGDLRVLLKLVFRIYQQHQQDEWGLRALDLIDQLCLEKFYGTEERFDEFER